IPYQTRNGDLNHHATQGQLHMPLVNGDVESSTRAEDIRLENVHGDLQLNAQALGSLIINPGNGELEVRVAMHHAAWHFRA
ncbi:hypothetical protein CWC09_18915, partial [Pseudoalteromonas ruthenica]